MKNLFKVFALCIVISTFLSMHVNAAEEAEVVISVTDQSGTYKGDVSIIFNFQSGPEKVIFSSQEIESNNSKGVFFQEVGEVVVLANLEGDNWKIVDETTGKGLDTVNLEKNTICNLNLLIQDKTFSSGNQGNYDDLFTFDNVKTTEKENKIYDVNEGHQLYKNFIDASYFMSDGSYDEWISVNAWSILGEVLKNTNLSEDEWNSLSQYEQFLYTVTYIQFAQLRTNNMESLFVRENEKGVPEDFRSLYFNCPNVDETTKEKYTKAWEEFMSWQFGYFRQNGYPYDFVRDMSYAEEVLGDVGSNKPQEESVTNNEIEEAMEVFENELSDEEKKQIVDVAKENMEKESATEVEKKSEEKGKWSEVVDKLLSMKVTLIILAVLLVALAVITIVIKKKNIDDMSSDGK